MEKVRLFRSLFRGRDDVYPVRWESKGRSGYSFACANLWRGGVCRKPKGGCAGCTGRQYVPLTDQTVYDHLAGKITIGVYALLEGDMCRFLAADFDEEDWRLDVTAFAAVARKHGLPVHVEISRSGNGAHAWLLFTEPVPARDARRLGSALVSRTCADTGRLSLKSYDRFFPSQDRMPKGGLGNLIALPLQKHPREQGRSVFVDEELVPHPDQWAYLLKAERIPPSLMAAATALLCPSADDELDTAFMQEDPEEPWRPRKKTPKLQVPLPGTLSVVVADRIYVPRDGLPDQWRNRILRLACFPNPEFHKAQAMRLPVWDKPRIVCCAEMFPHHILLPRGCMDSLAALAAENGATLETRDERSSGTPLETAFTGTLRPDQKKALDAMLAHDIGVLHAPTAFGKTVVAAAAIAGRRTSTLVLVHRADLMRQWRTRLGAFLDLPPEGIGTIGGGASTSNGKLDIALLQTLIRKENLRELLECYGHIIVDECHHISAASFETTVKQAKARYVLGLTATPLRRDGHDPVIHMQCGPVRHKAARPAGTPGDLKVLLRRLAAPVFPEDAKVQDVIAGLVQDEPRNRILVQDVLAACGEGRKVLVLTQRLDHLLALHEAVAPQVQNCFLLHGRLAAKVRRQTLDALAALPGDAPQCVMATGALIGEGFDHVPLDTLVLCLPVSFRGTLQQYAGRLHREHAGKRDVRIHDYVETGTRLLERMWERRRKGYAAMGYAVKEIPADAGSPA
jgi:superfamily II DNA or RNA helicase